MSKFFEGRHICKTPWGIGIYEYWDEDGVVDLCYGIGYPTDNPFSFIPDYESCTEKEIETWKKACEEFRNT